MKRTRRSAIDDMIEAQLSKVPVHLQNPKTGRAACGVRVRKGPYRSTPNARYATCRRPGCRST